MYDKLNNVPSGRFESHGSYRVFLPNPLPPIQTPSLDGEMAVLLTEAVQALSRLDGLASILPSTNLFLAMYVKQEAVLSSQIEGTQASLEDVLAYEAYGGVHIADDVEEVVNYVAALNLGVSLLDENATTIWMIRQIHQRLMQGVRGGDKQPGEIRTTQNFIGSADGRIEHARFVPPPPTMVGELLENLEAFLRLRNLPALVQAAYAHAQFETIHPFLDGNGRIGRLLIALILLERKALSLPLLYVSLYLKENRAEYYDRLQAIRVAGDWGGWLRFFLRGVVDVAGRATATAQAVIALDRKTREQLAFEGKRTGNLLRCIDALFQQPRTTGTHLAKKLDVSYQTANALTLRLVELGILREVTGNRRHRQFAFTEYLRLFES